MICHKKILCWFCLETSNEFSLPLFWETLRSFDILANLKEETHFDGKNVFFKITWVLAERERNLKNVKLTHNSTPEVMMNKWKILRWENFGWNFILQNIYPWKIFTPKNVPPKNIFTPVKDSPLKGIHLWKIFIAEKYSPLGKPSFVKKKDFFVK